MAVKKTVAKQEAKKFGEIGYEFPAILVIGDIDDQGDGEIYYGLEVKGVPCSVEGYVNKQELHCVRYTANPKAKLEELKQSLKEAQAKVAAVQKEIDNFKG